MLGYVILFLKFFSIRFQYLILLRSSGITDGTSSFMKRHLALLLLFAGFISCNNSGQESDKVQAIRVIEEDEVEIPVYDFEHLQPLLNKEDDKIRVINFWATWCKPCIAEIPYFEKLNENYRDENVEVVLVSLDFPDQVESRLIPFIKNNKLESEVVYLDDPHSNIWIPKVSESWSGAIPATLIYGNGKREFYEGSFTYEELEAEILKFKNNQSL